MAKSCDLVKSYQPHPMACEEPSTAPRVQPVIPTRLCHAHTSYRTEATDPPSPDGRCPRAHGQQSRFWQLEPTRSGAPRRYRADRLLPSLRRSGGTGPGAGVRHNEFEQNGLIEASTRIFLDAVAINRVQFLFLAREQYGGSLPIRQAIATLRQCITDDLCADLQLMNRMPHLDVPAIEVVSDLVVKTVFATLPELIDPPPAGLPAHLSPEAKITQQLRFIMVGGRHWLGPGRAKP
jgi:hypothetical protein